MQLDFDTPNQGLYLQITEITGVIEGDFEACAAYIFCVWGHFKAKFHKHGLRIFTDIDLAGEQLANGKVVPKINLQNFSLELHDDDIEIDISDSIVAWAADIFIYFFKGLILPGIVHDIEKTVPQEFNSIVNDFMKTTGGLLDTGIYDMGIDFSYSAPVEVKPDHLMMFFNGTVFNYTAGEYVPKVGAAVMKVDEKTTDST